MKSIAYGVRCRTWADCDPYVSESQYFKDFQGVKNEFEYWLAIEEELYQSIGYEHFFDEDQSL